MNNADTFNVHGVEQMLCTKHRLEFCDPCIVDFRDMNQIMRAEAKVEKLVQCSGPDCVKMGMNKCRQCGRTRYCSRECQKQHWKEGGHKKECVPQDPMYFDHRETGQKTKIHGIGTVCRLRREDIDESSEDDKAPRFLFQVLAYDEEGGNADELARVAEGENDPPEYLYSCLANPNERKWMTCEEFHTMYPDIVDEYE